VRIVRYFIKDVSRMIYSFVVIDLNAPMIFPEGVRKPLVGTLVLDGEQVISASSVGAVTKAAPTVR
jgi:hypothetical protein